MPTCGTTSALVRFINSHLPPSRRGRVVDRQTALFAVAAPLTWRYPPVCSWTCKHQPSNLLQLACPGCARPGPKTSLCDEVKYGESWVTDSSHCLALFPAKAGGSINSTNIGSPRRPKRRKRKGEEEIERGRGRVGIGYSVLGALRSVLCEVGPYVRRST